MTSAPLAAHDAIAYLVQQHEEIAALMRQVDEAGGDTRREAFVALRRLLAVHETAEEEIVHPRARRALDAGEQIVAWRLQEETIVKQMLTEVEGLDVDSTEFEIGFGQLRDAVLSHASAEEGEEFPLLADLLDDDQLARMHGLTQFAQAVAPTRPHPDLDTATANLLVGPFASMVDRVRDALENTPDSPDARDQT